MCNTSPQVKGIATAASGVLFTAVIAIIGWAATPEIIANVAKKTTVLEEGKFVWDLWSEPPFPIYTDFFIFNCTNYNEVVANGAKPRVSEIGPYSYREFRKKNTTVYENTDEAVYYREERWYYYSKETSHPSVTLQDEIVTVNPIYLTISTFLEEYEVPSVVARPIQRYLNDHGENIFKKVTAGEYLFDGWSYQVYLDLYDLIRNNSLPGLPDLPIFGTLPDLPSVITEHPYLSLFGMRNNTNDGLFRVNRGTKDYREFGNIEGWSKKIETFSSYLPYWGTCESYCNKIQGTDGTIFPYGDLEGRIFIYQTDLCRSIYTVYEKDEEYEGLLARKLVVPKSVLENRTNAPENACFCLDENDEGKCPSTGAVFLGACYEGAPLIGSNAHFLHGDPRYINGVDGLNPTKEKHETVILLEKRTNVLLYAAKRVQLNFDLKKSVFSDTEKITRVFIPALWYEENVRIDDETKENFNIFVVVEAVLWTLFAIGLLVTVIGIFVIVYYRRKEKNGRRYV